MVLRVRHRGDGTVRLGIRWVIIRLKDANALFTPWCGGCLDYWTLMIVSFLRVKSAWSF